LKARPTPSATPVTPWRLRRRRPMYSFKSKLREANNQFLRGLKPR
jgi:hypothetical protein